jgi:nucleoside phosphorylase/tetratricopeptide (TPR) repeat protein
MRGSSVAPRVFISYSHDSPEHCDRVLALSDRLREEGVDCHIDQYEPSPATPWPQWMLDQVEAATFVLVVCTEEYNSRFRGKAKPGTGLGVRWEGAIISQELYDAQGGNDKFRPVVFCSEDKAHIPIPLRGYTHYQVDSESGYEELYRWLTRQPGVVIPDVGEIVPMPAKVRKQDFKVASSTAAPARKDISISRLPVTATSLSRQDAVPLSPDDESMPKCDVLLVTVTDVETRSLLETAKTHTNCDYKERPGKHKTYFDLGVIGGALVFAVRSEMGSDTIGGSVFTVLSAIAEVKPSAVIMVGIAFGVNPKKQKIGEILVAEQLQPYELQRVGTTETGTSKIILRGDKPHCSGKLLDRFRAAHMRWGGPKVNFGLVLSGQKLIDNLDFRDQLVAISQGAIGGEMEGGGLYAACQQSKVDWILVKAICDWADGTKSVRKKKRQTTAAQNAADFVITMLASGLLARPQSGSVTTSAANALQPQQQFSRLPHDRISIARLPITGSNLFGRDEELQRLDEAWVNPKTNIIAFLAWGGVGKTALVNQWLKRRMARDNYRGAERVYGWSFYSQGTGERAASADLFIDQALRWFDAPDPTAGSPWDKGERLAHLVRQTRTLLVLDGLEPLQHPPGPQEGRLKDAAMQALLIELAAGQPGLCVISTRQRVGDLVEFEGSSVVQQELEHLSPQAGAELLRTQGVKGDDDELEQAVTEYKGHALALTLLGSYLTDVCGGDIRRRNEIESLDKDARLGRHAERVMRAYEKWLGEGIEVSVLRLLGLFDRPAEAASIAAVRAAPTIQGLTEPLQGLKKLEWQQALAKLRRIKLLGEETAEGALDAHPLVREHFRQQLKQERPEAWKEANNRLYEHLKRTAKEFPATVEEMSPLFAAVAHGCAAGRPQEALEEVHLRRIRRGQQSYCVHKLGAFGADLAALSGFFEVPWEQPVAGLTDACKGFVLGEAGFDLRALGRLQEATQPMQAGLEAEIAIADWQNAAIAAGNLSELYLTIGNLPPALKLAQQGVGLADRSGGELDRLSMRAKLADALHQVGRIGEACDAFREAEEAQKQQDAEHPLLYSLAGFRYCDLLLDQGWVQEVKERAARTLAWARQQGWLLDTALDNLSLGRAFLLEAQQTGACDSAHAAEALRCAVDGLRQAGTSHHLPRGLLGRAALHRVTGDRARAERDLAEATRIAARGGMGLHLADCHLESARLQLAQGNRDKAVEHWETAKAMIERMGYHRRDKEVDEIAQKLN